MYKQVIIYLLLILLSQKAFSQEKPSLESKPPLKPEINNTTVTTTEDLYKKIPEDNIYIINEVNVRYVQSLWTVPKINEQPQFNIVSSFNNNIKWGGFWYDNAVVNFNPAMFIQPADFISIYASHCTSVFVSMSAIKENIKPLAIEGAAILAIDNAVKFILHYNKTLQSVINFAAKTLAINLIRSSQVKSNPLPDFKFYYCAISIRY